MCPITHIFTHKNTCSPHLVVAVELDPVVDSCSARLGPLLSERFWVAAAVLPDKVYLILEQDKLRVKEGTGGAF